MFGALLGILLIYVLISKIDLNSLLMQMSSVGFYFAAVIFVTFTSQFMISIAWRLSFLKPLPWKNILSLFNIRLIGESLAQINPTSVIAGDTLKGIILKDQLGVSYHDGAVSILFSRIMIILSGGILFTFGVIIMFQHLSYGNLRTITAVICSIIVLISVLFVRGLKTRRGVFSSIAAAMRRVLGRFQSVQRAADNLLEIDADLIEFYDEKKLSFYIVFFLSLFHRIVGSLEYFVIFYALGIDVSILSCILFDLASMVFRASGFFIPGQLGLEEFGNKIMFSLVHIPGAETWVTVSLVRRGRQIFWILMGFIVYLFLSRSVKNELKEVSSVEN